MDSLSDEEIAELLTDDPYGARWLTQDEIDHYRNTLEKRGAFWGGMVLGNLMGIALTMLGIATAAAIVGWK